MSPELNAVAQAVVALKSRRIDDSVSAWSIAHELAETITGRERRGVPNMVAWPVFEGDLKQLSNPVMEVVCACARVASAASAASF
jgi:uncharacterized protein (DUF2062 family)